MQQLTLKDYLDSEPNVISARNKLKAAEAALNEATEASSALDRVPQNLVAPERRSQLKKDIDELTERVNRLSTLVNQIESNTASYFKKNYKEISTALYQTTLKKLEKQLTTASASPGVPEEAKVNIQTHIDELKGAIANPRSYQEPPLTKQELEAKTKAEAGAKTKTEAEARAKAEADQKLQDEINASQQKDKINSYKYIADLSVAGRKRLAKELNKVYGSKLPVDGEWSPDLITAYQKMLQDRLTHSLSFGKNESTAEFLRVADKSGVYRGKGGKTSTTDTDVTVTRKTAGQIDVDINEIAVKVLGRSISEEDKGEDWYVNLVNSINKMYEKGTKTVTNKTSISGDGSTVSGTKRVVTPSVAEADIDALIERRLRKNNSESVGRKERLDFVSWMNKALGG